MITFYFFRDEAAGLAEKFKMVTVADLIESMEVSVSPFALEGKTICRIYKLKMRLNRPKRCSLAHCEEVLEIMYRRALEDAIETHIILLSKISGIKNFVAESNATSSKDDPVGNDSRNEDDDGIGDDGGDIDDLGTYGAKLRQQVKDDMDYDSGSDEEHGEAEPASGFESEVDQGEKEDADDNEKSEMKSSSDRKTKSIEKKKKIKRKFAGKEYDRACFSEANGLDFEIHFKFKDEPHILLAQVFSLLLR